MGILLKTDGKVMNIAVSTKRVLFSVETEGISAVKNIKYTICNCDETGNPNIEIKVTKQQERYLYLDADMFDDGEKYCWYVTLYTDVGEIVSDYAYFEKGISQENFSAKWIENPQFDGRVSEFEKSFNINGKIEKARLYIVGLGFADSFINGKKADEYYFKPVLTDFDKRIGLDNPHYNEENFGCSQKTVCYDVFDVQKLLKQGQNKINVLLGTGWYCNEDKNITDPSYSYAQPKLFFELHVKTDKESIIVTSDQKCLVRNTNVKSQMFAGDYVDFTADGQEFVGAKIAIPPSGELIPNFTENDKILSTINPINVVEKHNFIEYDFGKNHTGSLHLKVKGKKGSKLIINYYENKKDGELNPITSRWYAYKDGLDIIGYLDQTSEYVLSGEVDEIIPYFHWNCYRFATVEADAKFEILSVESLFIASDIPVDGEFSCSDEFLNRFNDAFILTQIDNMHCGIPSDCPTRERLPYTGDGQLVAETVMYSFNAESFYRKWLKDIIDSQGKNGFVSNTAPIIAGGGGFWWTNALVVIPRVLYNYTGDKQILKDAYKASKKLIEFYDSIHNGDYIMRKSYIKWFLGDWCTPKQTVIDIPYVNTLAAYYATEQMLFSCEVLGKTEDKSKFIELKEKFKNAINKFYFDEQKCEYANGIQGANLMPAINGVAEQKVAEKLIEKIVEQYEKDPHFDTGIIMTPILLDVLSVAGREDLALRLLTEKTAPSFYDMIDGETTLVEFWIKHDPIKTTISHCHPMFGSVLAWIYKNVAGMDLSALYKKEIVFSPKVIDKVKSARIYKRTPYGIAGCEYQAVDGFNMKIKVPHGVNAKVKLPCMVKDVAFKSGYRVETLLDGKYNAFNLQGGEYEIVGNI